ncbi:MAG: 50S ribosomal protein L10 [Chloroflexi bacterium]|nr:50S ribosomal protein L10 [Chloroflexota bacterium]
MAVSKEHKKEIVATYQDWLGNSQAVFLAEYIGLTVKDMDALRDKVREVGGEFHVIKNTLGKLAFEGAGYEVPQNYFLGSTAAGFAFEDAAAMAKAMADFSKSVGFLKIKGGYLEANILNAEEIKALAELPPLPVVQARLLSTFLAPASQLVRTLAEPARQVASVFQAYADTESAPAES